MFIKATEKTQARLLAPAKWLTVAPTWNQARAGLPACRSASESCGAAINHDHRLHKFKAAYHSRNRCHWSVAGGWASADPESGPTPSRRRVPSMTQAQSGWLRLATARGVTINLKLALECSAATDTDGRLSALRFTKCTFYTEFQTQEIMHFPFSLATCTMLFKTWRKLKLFHSFTVGRNKKSVLVLIKKGKVKGCEKCKGKRASGILADAAVGPNLKVFKTKPPQLSFFGAKWALENFRELETVKLASFHQPVQDSFGFSFFLSFSKLLVYDLS